MFCNYCGGWLDSAERSCAGCGQPARPVTAQTPFERALALMREGDYEPATEWLLEALVESAEKVPALLMLAHAYWLRDDMPAAEDWLRQVLVLAPEQAYTHALLGSVLLAQCKVAAARDALDTALHLAPDDVRVRVKRAEYFYRLGCYAEGSAELEHALRVPAPDPEVRAYARDLLREAQHRARRALTRKPLPFLLGRQPSAVNSK